MPGYLVSFYRHPRSGFEIPAEIKRREEILKAMQSNGDMHAYASAISTFSKCQGLVLDTFSVMIKAGAPETDVSQVIKTIYQHVQEVRILKTEE